ncbi:Outer membrane efflux protein [Phycisphaerae bacterium RAS1]|nr:Outer membrane efflux protein [Phycisphaerae bacterium RAS1]
MFSEYARRPGSGISGWDGRLARPNSGRDARTTRTGGRDARATRTGGRDARATRRLVCRFSLLLCVLAAVNGCARVDAQPQIDRSADLVEQRLGTRPAWSAPWDDAAPPWDAQSVLEIDAAIGLALRNNRELRAELEMIAQADADLVQAGLLTNPSLNFMMMFVPGGGKTMLRSAGFPSQALQDLWLIPSREQAARSELQQAVLRVADRAIEIATRVRKLHVRLQFGQAAVELVRQNMALVDQSVRLLQTRYSAGQATQVELNLMELRALRLRSELSAEQAELRALKREMLMLLGLAGAADVWQVLPLAGAELTLLPDDEAALWARAADERLDLQAADWRMRAAEDRLEMEKLAALPDLTLGFTFERAPARRAPVNRLGARVANAAAQGLVNGIEGGMPFPEVRPIVNEPREIKWTLGPMIDVELPIFDQNQAQVAKAASECRQRAAELEARVQEMILGVRQALLAAQQAGEQARLYRDEIAPAVQRNIDLAQESFAAGRESLAVYLQAQEDLIMARRKTLEYERDAIIWRAELLRQIGGGELEPGPRPSSEPRPQGSGS